MNNITVERLEQIEQEREEVMFSPAFKQWMKDLNVSRSYADPTPLFNAQVMNSQYSFRDSKSILDKIIDKTYF